MTKTLFDKEYPSTTEAIGQALSEVLEVLARHDWCKTPDGFCIRLCVEEALVNAVSHGNKYQPHRSVHVSIFEDGERCKIRVRDEGEGFDPEAISMPDCEQLGGRGVCLIKHFMDDVRFDCGDHCLEMEFSRDTFVCEEK